MDNIDTTAAPLVLSRNAHIILRPPTGLQCGTDPERAGIVALPEHLIAKVAGVLAACRRPTLTLPRQLRNTGLGIIPSRNLISDLLAHGVLTVFVPDREVAILGRSHTASLVADILTETGMKPRLPQRDESEGSFLLRISESIPAIDIGFRHLLSARSALLARRRTIIPARIVDGEVIIGPLRIDGDGPCPFCIDLHELRADPQARILRSQLSAAMRFDPLCEHMLASRVAAILHNLTEPLPGPGMQVERPEPGQVVRMSPYRDEVSVGVMERLKLCPLCEHPEGKLPPLLDAEVLAHRDAKDLKNKLRYPPARPAIVTTEDLEALDSLESPACRGLASVPGVETWIEGEARDVGKHSGCGCNGEENEGCACDSRCNDSREPDGTACYGAECEAGRGATA